MDIENDGRPLRSGSYCFKRDFQLVPCAPGENRVVFGVPAYGHLPDIHIRSVFGLCGFYVKCGGDISVFFAAGLVRHPLGGADEGQSF